MNRTEWLAWRHRGLGASEVACLYGASPYMSELDLFNIKTAKEYIDKPSNPVQRRGNEMEPIARKKFSALYNMEHGTDEDFSAKFVSLEELPFILASLDGASKDGMTIVEFKCMSEPIKDVNKLTKGQMKHMNVLDASLPLTCDTDGVPCRVPYMYWIQIQHQLLCSGARKCFFVSFDGETLHSCEVLPDLEFMKNHIKVCTEFWKKVQDGKAPEAGADDFVTLRDAETSKKVKRWKTLSEKAGKIEEEMETLRKDILSKVTHPRTKCAGVSIVECAGRAGSIDYPKILSELKIEVDVEKYRKPTGKPSWKMSVE
jgi:putative phage-type endonuclease